MTSILKVLLKILIIIFLLIIIINISKNYKNTISHFSNNINYPTTMNYQITTTTNYPITSNYPTTTNINNNYIDIVWSKGYPIYFGNKNNNYIFSSTEEPVNNNDIIDQIGNQYIWIKSTSQIHILNNNITIFLDNSDKFNYPFILITSDGDCSIPEEIDVNSINKLLDNPYLLNWYTQNYSIKNVNNVNINKIKPIPIGFALHWYSSTLNPQEQLKLLLNVKEDNNNNKKLKIYCDLHHKTFNKFDNQRKIIAELGFNTIDYQMERIHHLDLWKNYTDYTFVISTHGNGLDCHRTWEILLLGCIVITKTSSIDSLFIDLPVVIVKDWSELNNIDNLEKWKIKYTPFIKNIYEKLLIKNWIK